VAKDEELEMQKRLSPQQIRTLADAIFAINGLPSDAEVDGGIKTLRRNGKHAEELEPVPDTDFGTDPIGQFVIPDEEDKEELPHTEETAKGRIWKFNPDCESVDTTGLKLMSDPHQNLPPHIPCAIMFPSCALQADESNGQLENIDPVDPLAEEIEWGMGLNMDPYQACRRTRRFEGCDPDIHHT